MNHERGWKRIYAVAVVCWVAFCLVCVWMTENNPYNMASREEEVLWILVAAILVPIVGYIFFFRAIPWIVRGFK
jgi:peptidoglycan/LPS O-acetylase OafA/YrhL